MGAHRTRGPFRCKYCGDTYLTRRPKGEGEVFCSKGCFYEHQHESKKPSYTRIYISRCVECDSLMLGKTKKTLCSKACSAQSVSRTDRARATVAHQEDPARHLVRCDCGVEFCRLYGRKIQLCAKCANERTRERKREYRKSGGKTHISRAKHYGCEYTSFDPLSILKRDEWQCQICDCSTPERLRGTQDDNAPELDHIVPLAAGGEHTPENTQCLCRVCNSIKGTQSQSYMTAYHGAGAGQKL